MGVLKGPRAKLERAQTQAEALYAEMSVTLNPNPDAAPVDFRSHQHAPRPGQQEIIWEITMLAPEMPELAADFGLRLGEALHNFRGALDHAVWQLVNPRKLKLTVKQQRQVQFPMARTRKSYWSQVGYRLPGTSQEVRTLIERYQPYRRVRRGYFMRFLRDLTDLDKHRTIIVAPTYAGDADLELEWTHGCRRIGDRNILKSGQRVKAGTELGTLILGCPEHVEPEVAVQGTIYYGAAFLPSILRPWAGWIPIAARIALEGISDTCEEILSELEAHL